MSDTLEADLLVARALDGDLDAFRKLLEHPESVDGPEFAGILPALANDGARYRQTVPGSWKSALMRTATHGLCLESSLHEVGTVLDGAAIPWMPFKGMDLRSRLWPDPYVRPSSDLDVLIPKDRFIEARLRLVEAGWVDSVKGALLEDYLWAEGYNWQATNRIGTLLELHFRLWGAVPEEWIAAIWEQGPPAPGFGTCAQHPSLTDAFLICAAHIWLQGPPPWSFLYWRELELIARACGDEVLEKVRKSACALDLHLPTFLAAWNVFRLWKNPAMRYLADSMLSELKGAERLVAHWAVAKGVDAVQLEYLAFARLLAGRKTRMGWAAAFRRLWPHPANRQEGRE